MSWGQEEPLSGCRGTAWRLGRGSVDARCLLPRAACQLHPLQVWSLSPLLELRDIFHCNFRFFRGLYSILCSQDGGFGLWWSCMSVASRAGTRPPAAISPDRRETVFPLWFLSVQHGGAGPSPREGPGQCLTTRGTVSLASGVAPVCSRSQHSPLPLLARSERRANHVPAGHASLSSTGTGLVGRTPRLPPAP